MPAHRDDGERQGREAEEVEAGLALTSMKPNRSGRSIRAGGSQSKRAPSPKNCGLSSHAVVMSENDRVITAMVSPRRRSTGSPISVATAAPTSPAPSRPSPRSQPQRAVIEPPTAAPIATNAICPRLISPPHPVSTTSESAITA